jgi:hypothetical protein
MTEQIEKFLQASPGRFSSARLMFVAGLLWAMAVSTAGLFTLHWTAGEFIAVFAGISSPFIALKLGQKSMEKPLTEGGEK